MSAKSPCILFCSLSAKQALYREVLKNAQLFSGDVRVIGTDCDSSCDAASKVDHFITMPRLDQLSDEHLLEFCQQNKITHILPTRDAELPFWAERKKMLAQHNICTWVSDPSFVKYCEDKLLFFKQWKDGAVSCIDTFEYPNEPKIQKWVAKARTGSGSNTVFLNLSPKDAKELSVLKSHNLVFQPFVQGKEFTAEAWVSRSKKCHGPLLRWRDTVVNGESHKTTVFRNAKWEEMLRSVFLHREGAHGHCLAQVLVDINSNLHLIEINPRLGGGSPLSLHAGLNSIAWNLMEDTVQANEIPLFSEFTEGLSLTKKNGRIMFSS